MGSRAPGLGRTLMPAPMAEAMREAGLLLDRALGLRSALGVKIVHPSLPPSETVLKGGALH